jgi:transcriptional regulator with XRE-family HTH domain
VRQYQAVDRAVRDTGAVNETATLGNALRHWRDRTDPADIGLPAYGVRRAPGLRREELALLAGMSVDYIVRLERGRATTPSVQVLAALARALRLSDPERDHLYTLAGQSAPTAGQISAHIPPSVGRLLDQLRHTPLSVHDAAWNLISWNPMWAALTGDPSSWRGVERNVAWRHFADLPSRVAHTPSQQDRFETALVSDLRSSAGRYPHDRALTLLISQIRSTSARFDELWTSHVVGVHVSDTKTIHHPDLGPITVDCDTLTIPGSDLRIAVCSAPPGTTASGQLELLAALGNQAMT